MKNLHSIGVLTALMLSAAVSAAASDPYAFRIVASGLARPTGITIEGSEVLYFTQVPTPGVSGARRDRSKAPWTSSKREPATAGSSRTSPRRSRERIRPSRLACG